MSSSPSPRQTKSTTLHCAFTSGAFSVAKPSDPVAWDASRIERELGSVGGAMRVRRAIDDGKLGPELTGKERTNIQNMLVNIIDPSASLREGYTLFQVKTRDQRTLVGFIDERDPNRLVLRDAGGQRTTVPPSDIVEEKALPTSLMPEGLLEGLSDQELRDFFAYLASPAVPGAKTSNR